MADASSPPGIVGFVYDRLLGSGGFADVFLYQDLDLRRLVAIKVLRSSIDDAETQAAFVAESQLMAQVSGHPYIVQIYSNGVAADGRPFLVMQYYPGESYSHRIHTKTLSVAETLEVGVQIASALETAHRVGIVHRDVKPSNILTDRYGKPGLTDFGIAGAVSDGSLGFSPPYAAPEVVVDEAAGDVSSDVFSLTATLYALLAGRSPFETADGDNTRTAVTARVLNEEPFPIGRIDVAPMFERLLVQGLSKDPTVRPTSALAFGRSLQAIQQTLHYTPTPLTLEDDQPTPTITPIGHGEAEQTRYAHNRSTDPNPTPETTDSALIREVPNAIDGPDPTPAPVETSASDATPDTGSTPPDDHSDATLIAPILCPNCGVPISADASYCSNCAHPTTPSASAPPVDLAPIQDEECPHCAAPVDSTAAFCTNCDQPTDAETPTLRPSPGFVPLFERAPGSKPSGRGPDTPRPISTPPANPHSDDGISVDTPVTPVLAASVAQAARSDAEEGPDLATPDTPNLEPAPTAARERTSDGRSSKAHSNRWPLVAAAISMILVIGAGGLIAWTQHNNESELSEVPGDEHETPSEASAIPLQDDTDPVAAGDEFKIAIVAPSASNDLAFTQSMVDAAYSIEGAEVWVSDGTFVVEDAAFEIRDYAELGFDLVIAHGSQYGGSLQEIAPDFPEVSFAWGTAADTFGLPNVFSYEAASDEGGIVMGKMAAALSQSANVGIVGPIEVGDAKLYVDGFEAGVKSQNPDAIVTVDYIDSFVDVALAAEAAKSLIGAGADVMSGTDHMAVGAVGVARTEGVLWFGNQSNQTLLAPEIVVASQVYHWEHVLNDIVKNVQNGTLGGEEYSLTLANGGLVIEYNADFDLPSEVRELGIETVASFVDDD